MSTTLDAVCRYAGKWGLPIFPCSWDGKKHPLVKWGTAATTDPEQITVWWGRRWPEAWIGLPTGSRSGIVVLDIDIKRPEANGFDTLEALGRSILPDTAMAHTGSGGLHVYFRTIDIEIRNSAGKTGLGPGLDVRGEGGFVVLPPSSGYWWDPHWSLLNGAPLEPAPRWLGHRQKQESESRANGTRLNPQTILANACQNIRQAGGGNRHDTLNREVFTVAKMVRAGALPERLAHHQLEAAITTMTWSTAGDRHKAARDFADAWREGRR